MGGEEHVDGADIKAKSDTQVAVGSPCERIGDADVENVEEMPVVCHRQGRTEAVVYDSALG